MLRRRPGPSRLARAAICLLIAVGLAACGGSCFADPVLAPVRPLTAQRQAGGHAARRRRRRTSTGADAAGALQPRRPRRPGAGVRPQQHQQHRQRDQPQTYKVVQVPPAPCPSTSPRPTTSRRCTSTTTSATASRRSTRGPASPAGPSRSRTRTTCTSPPTGATRSSSPSASSGSTSATRTTMRCATRCRYPCAGRRPHGLLRRRALRLRQLRVRGRMIKIDMRTPAGDRARSAARRRASPQDVKLSPDGRILYVADQVAGGVMGDRRRDIPRDRLPADRRGRPRLYPSRDARVCTSPTGRRARSRS